MLALSTRFSGSGEVVKGLVNGLQHSALFHLVEAKNNVNAHTTNVSSSFSRDVPCL